MFLLSIATEAAAGSRVARQNTRSTARKWQSPDVRKVADGEKEFNTARAVPAAPACLRTAGARRSHRVRRDSIGGVRRDESRTAAPGAPPTMDLDGARSAVYALSVYLIISRRISCSLLTKVM